MDKFASEGSFDTSEAFFTAGIDRVNSAERSSSSGTHDVTKIGDVVGSLCNNRVIA